MEKVEEKTVPKFKELPNNLKKKLIKEFSIFVFKCIKFRHYVMFFSFWALAYQTRNLVATYLEFQTVVKVEITKPFTVDYPGTTICTDKYHMVLKSKIRERYPEIMDEIKAMNTTDENLIIQVYRKYRQKAFENSTLGQWFDLMIKADMLLDCKLILKPNWHQMNNYTGTNQSYNIPTCNEFSIPYASLPYGAGLCFTYFSQINRANYTSTETRYEFYKVDIPEEGKLTSFRVKFDVFDNDVVYDDAPPTIENQNGDPEIYIIVNHPKALPASISLDKAVIKRGTNFQVFFTQTNARLLRWPFATNCIWYEWDRRWRQWKSSDHCIDECLTAKLIRECGCVFNESRGGRITKYAKPEIDYPICKEYNREKGEIPPKNGKPERCTHRMHFESHNTECRIEGRCNNNCYEEYYRYEVKEVFFDEEEDGHIHTDEEDEFRTGELLFQKARSNQSFSTVNFIRKDMADVTYEHTAEMVFVEFVCYFGGLLGLWLGVSILDMYHQCLIWWDEVPIEYAKWVQRQKFETNVEEFGAKQKQISVISGNYNSENDYNSAVRNIYITKY